MKGLDPEGADVPVDGTLDELEANGLIVWTGDYRLDPDGKLRKVYRITYLGMIERERLDREWRL